MTKARVEAFSDGVVAILITIMILDLRVPRGTSWSVLAPVFPHLLTYILSFVFLGIYWSNHHHMFQTVHRVNGAILWANLHLLFWLSLVPFVTGWMGEHGGNVPVASYGIVLLMCAIAYTILQSVIIAHEPSETLAAAVGGDLKGKVSMALYIAAIPLAFVHEAISYAIFVIVALMWLAPDRRIESRIAHAESAHRPS
jgi:uncharacterized membrane protein